MSFKSGQDGSVGQIVYFGTGSTTQSTLYYLNTDGGWNKTNANGTGSIGTSSAGNAGFLGIALGTNPLVDGMLVRGTHDVSTIYQDSWVTGSAVYVQSGSVSGLLSGSAPTATNSYVRVVGYCTATPSVIYFNPDSVWVEIS